MTYFDPEIYNEDNLNPNDKAEVKFWQTEFENAIYEAEFNMFTAERIIRDICDARLKHDRNKRFSALEYASAKSYS